MKKSIIIYFFCGIIIGSLFCIIIINYNNRLKSDAAYGYSVFLLSNKDEDHAVMFLYEAIFMYKKNYKPYISLGLIYEKNGKKKLAIEMLEKVIELERLGVELLDADKQLVIKQLNKLNSTNLNP